MTKAKKPATTQNTDNKHENTVKKSVDLSKFSRSTERGSPSVVAKNQELESMLKRTLADYQNLERRIEEERKQLSKLSALLLIEKLLPIADNLESAQNHIQDQGLAIVIKQFKDILTSEGVEEIQAEGQSFDPNFHEAVEIQQGREDNKIVKVLTKGYKIEDKVIRPAKVVVERKEDSPQARMTNNEDQVLDSLENDTVGGENI